MRDREDAGVLAAATIVRIDLLVTDNLKHFSTIDSEELNIKEVFLRGPANLPLPAHDGQRRRHGRHLDRIRMTPANNCARAAGYLPCRVGARLSP
jgi:hypothetical protein